MANGNESGKAEVSLEVSGLWKIFGKNAEKIIGSELEAASKEDILKKTGCVVAVRDVSFQVTRGEFFVIMGLSGSGKSTVIRLLLRLIEPTAGNIFIDGKDISGYTNKQLVDLRRHTTSMVFQNFGLLPHRNVIDNVAYALKIRGTAKTERYARARETIETVGLEGWENHFPSELSGGMQQRVGIARALAMDPEILLMDEPFSGLDPLIRREMQDELLDILEKVKKTIVFVTHDLDEALKLGGRIAIMRDGEIIQIGTPEEVIKAPGDAYVREFVQDASLAKVVTASSIMEKPKVLLYEWQGPKAAFQIIKDNMLDYAFLVTRAQKLLGLVPRRRLVELIRRKGISLKDALEPDLPTCTPDMVIEDLFPLATTTEYPIPVVNDNGKLLGEIDTRAILESMISESDTGAEETEGKEAKADA
ncbi:MAG: glycine betaine/L-proline ABC transporter ATP-binding protein [Dehalococcoidia bacterium]|nr:glycine betaine/L-proline ABC transporter ATP-binding protein [Dehalococcoidia bacterium]